MKYYGVLTFVVGLVELVMLGIGLWLSLSRRCHCR